MWLLSQFKAPFSTLMGRNMFGDHASFILLLLVPFYWVAPGAWIMFFFQSLAIGAGAIPVFLYGRQATRLGVVRARRRGDLPAAPGGRLDEPRELPSRRVPRRVRRLRDLRRARVEVAAVRRVRRAVAAREGGCVARHRAARDLGGDQARPADRADHIVGSIAFMLVAMYLVMRSLIGVPTRNGWRIPFGGPRGVIDTAVTNPTDARRPPDERGRPWYLWQMTAPFAWLFLRLPSVAAISALVLFTNILSTFWYQHQIEYHYSLVAVPALAIGTVYAIGAVRERVEWSGIHVPLRALTVVVLGVATLVTAYLWAPVPWGRTAVWYGDPDRAEAVAARELIGRDPRRRRRAAHYRITPQIAYRERDLPVPDAVPGRAVRARHVDSRGPDRGPRRAGRVRDDPDRPGRAAAWPTGRRSRRPSTSSTRTTTGSSTTATPTSRCPDRSARTVTSRSAPAS